MRYLKIDVGSDGKQLLYNDGLSSDACLMKDCSKSNINFILDTNKHLTVMIDSDQNLCISKQPRYRVCFGPSFYNNNIFSQNPNIKIFVKA